MADPLVAPTVPASTFTPNPTVDAVQAKVIAQLTGEGEPQTAPEIPLPEKPQDAPKAPPPPPAPTEMDRLRKQMQRKEAEYQAAGSMAQRKYEAQIQESANKIAILEARLSGMSPSTDDKLTQASAPDPFQSKVEKYIAEQSKRQAELEAKISAQENEKQAMSLYTQWETEAKTTVGKPEFSDLATYCKLEGLDPVSELAKYTHSNIQSKGITLATDDAAEDLNIIAARKLAEYKKHFGSGSVAQAIADKQIHGLGGAPESGTQGKPTTQQESFDSLVDNLESKGFFKQG